MHYRLKEASSSERERQWDKYACRGPLLEVIRVHSCDCASGHADGTERRKKERNVIPVTVIVVTAGVIPASLQSERKVLASLQAHKLHSISAHNPHPLR